MHDQVSLAVNNLNIPTQKVFVKKVKIRETDLLPMKKGLEIYKTFYKTQSTVYRYSARAA
jgi:hypothetical protein